MNKFLGLASASVAAMALAMSMSANATVIDLFQNPVVQAVADPVSGPTAQNANNFNENAVAFPASIIGGYRDIKADVITGGIDNNGNTVCDLGDSCTRMTVSAGVLSFSNDAPAAAGEGIVQWDGQDNSENLDTAVGLGGVSLRNQAGCPVTGCEFFRFEVLSADLGFNFKIGIWTDTNNFTEFELIAGGGPGVRVIPFAAFENPGLCDTANIPGGIANVDCGPAPVGTVGGNQVANLNSVNALQLILNPGGGTTAVDLSIGAITKFGVPEPGIVGLMGLGLVGFGLAGIKRRKKRA